MTRESSLDSLYGMPSHPYFIYAPRWIDSSAGIKALHFLCHALNLKGQKAYLALTEPPHNGEPRINPNLLTPILTPEVSDAYFRSGVTPVVIYSETVPGNPLGSTCVVRYLMNFAGALGGSEIFDENEYVISFSKRIATHYSQTNNLPEPPVLFIPPIDPREFTKNEIKLPYQVVYAGKYRSFIGKPPKVGYLDSIEIFRDGPRMQTRSQVKEILRNASVLFSFENSSIVTEAILSGTPAHFVPNVFLGEIIAETELGFGGISKSAEPHDISKARESIDEGIHQYYARAYDFLNDLDEFVIQTQHRAKCEGFRIPIIVPNHSHFINQHRIGLARQILKSQGISTLLRVTYHFVLRRLSWRYWIGRERR